MKLDECSNVEQLLRYIWNSKEHPLEPHCTITTGDFGMYAYEIRYYKITKFCNNVVIGLKEAIKQWESERL